jgi:hypothetical protein
VSDWTDAARWSPNGSLAVVEQCSGACHEVGDDGCSRCCSGIALEACEDCRFYMAQDAEASR